MKIIGFACCPVGAAAGHDADECRANLVEDGSIVCITCATRYPKMSPAMQQIWQTICRSGFSTPEVEIGSKTQPGTPAYDAACLSGYDPRLSDRVQASFRAGKASVRLDYEQSNEAELQSPDRSLARSLSAGESAQVPDKVKALIQELALLGFCLRCFQSQHRNRIVMTCGRPVGSMGFVLGANAEICWDN